MQSMELSNKLNSQKLGDDSLSQSQKSVSHSHKNPEEFSYDSSNPLRRSKVKGKMGLVAFKKQQR
jgi:hypothetical protein